MSRNRFLIDVAKAKTKKVCAVAAVLLTVCIAAFLLRPSAYWYMCRKTEWKCENADFTINIDSEYSDKVRFRPFLRKSDEMFAHINGKMTVGGNDYNVAFCHNPGFGWFYACIKPVEQPFPNAEKEAFPYHAELKCNFLKKNLVLCIRNDVSDAFPDMGLDYTEFVFDY